MRSTSTGKRSRISISTVTWFGNNAPRQRRGRKARERGSKASRTARPRSTPVMERPDPDANSIAWLVWHLTRIQDDHVADIAGREQVWTADGWHGRLGLPVNETETGYGHTSEQVASIRVDHPGLLLGYHDAVVDRTVEYVGGIDAAELDRVIDTSYDPPVTVGVRLVSVISDNIQHAGQARYVRGIYDRTR